MKCMWRENENNWVKLIFQRHFIPRLLDNYCRFILTNGSTLKFSKFWNQMNHRSWNWRKNIPKWIIFVVEIFPDSTGGDITYLFISTLYLYLCSDLLRFPEFGHDSRTQLKWINNWILTMAIIQYSILSTDSITNR